MGHFLFVLPDFIVRGLVNEVLPCFDFKFISLDTNFFSYKKLCLEEYKYLKKNVKNNTKN